MKKYIAIAVAIAVCIACGGTKQSTDVAALKDDTDNWLLLPISVHLGGSNTWTENSLAPVLSRVQQIYNQAEVKFKFNFTQSSQLARGALDLFYQPAVYDPTNGNRVWGYGSYTQWAKVQDYCGQASPSTTTSLHKQFDATGKSATLSRGQSSVATITAHELGHGLQLPHLGRTLMRLDIGSSPQFNLSAGQIITIRSTVVNFFGGQSAAGEVQPPSQTECTIKIGNDLLNRGNGRTCELVTATGHRLSYYFNVQRCEQYMIDDLKDDDNGTCANITVDSDNNSAATKSVCKIKIGRDRLNRGNGRTCELVGPEGSRISYYYNVSFCRQYMIEDLSDDHNGECQDIEVES